MECEKIKANNNQKYIKISDKNTLEDVVKNFLSDQRFEVIANGEDDFFEGTIYSNRIKLKLKKGTLKLIYRREETGFTDEDKHERLVIFEAQNKYSYISAKENYHYLYVNHLIEEINKIIEQQNRK